MSPEGGANLALSDTSQSWPAAQPSFPLSLVPTLLPAFSAPVPEAAPDSLAQRLLQLFSPNLHLLELGNVYFNHLFLCHRWEKAYKPFHTLPADSN